MPDPRAAGSRQRPPHTVVKVCGLTRLEDARVAVEAGADWFGFILWEHSPRAVTVEAAAAIVATLELREAVAVMVSPTPAEALEAARAIGAARVQLHRISPAEWPAGFPLPVSFAIAVDADGRLSHTPPGPDHVVLLDSGDELLAGGTGRTFPWEAARALARQHRVMLAGGLDGDRVGEAIAMVEPFGVDAASRLESSPGRKDHERLRRFVAAARAADDRGNGEAI